MSIWGCEKPILKKIRFEKDYTPYPHLIVHDSEALLAPLNGKRTNDLMYLSRHTPMSVAIH